jgi:RNA polymerase sigma factor (TIGR02999 family)
MTPGEPRAESTVTRLLRELDGGHAGAADEIFALLYQELRGIAHRHRRRWEGDDTLNTTALVHEAYVKLVGQARIGVESRAHFLALAARAMRHILCNYSRDRRAGKRGGDAEILTLDELQVPAGAGVFARDPSDTLLALDQALRRLEQVDPRQGKVVECRFFGGLTLEETATALDVSPRTVQRDWAMAQAWLHREVTSDL